jgi:branched-chain amino acid transport system ATP-binding protein
LILEVDGLTKRFGGTVALEGVSLGLPAGAMVGMIGPNGSGKTTLLNVVSGALRADAGRIRFKGEDITALPANVISRRGLVRTFQISRPFAKMSVVDNVLAAAHTRLTPEVRERARAIAVEVGLERVLDQAAGRLSFGQQRLVELARMLMLDPELILLDEPAAGVNPTLMEHLRELIQGLHARGKSFLIVEHNVRLVSRMCDRLIVLHNGDKIADAPLEQVLADPAVKEAYLGTGHAVARPKHRLPGHA